MPDLHTSLSTLHPRDYPDVPTSDLQPFLESTLSAAEAIANSVPHPPGGTPHPCTQPTRSPAEPRATHASELTISDVRPPLVDDDNGKKAWGSPVKLGIKESDASGMSVWKTAGRDRRGAWFARASVHEGLGFARWVEGMKAEFEESLKIKEGKPGEGNVRGIGAEARLESEEVKGVGRLEVYRLSAQFPGPTSPREFITMLITSDACLSDAPTSNGKIPRHYMVVSIPVTHPDAPPRDGMVRGAYESIELIREIPLPNNPDPETNPVEWIMVTRSDPGGGIPRFMVERNVPSSIVQDAVKFLDWACARPVGSDDDFPEEKHDNNSLAVPPPTQMQREPSLAGRAGVAAGVGSSIADRPESSQSYLSQLADAVGSYIPDAMNPMPQYGTTSSTSTTPTTSSAASFASAEQFATAEQNLNCDAITGEPSTSIISSSADPHARELSKIDAKKSALQARLAAAREKQAEATALSTSKSAKEQARAAEKHERDLKKQQEKYDKEIRKLDAKRDKEERKLRQKREKEEEKQGIAGANRERDEALEMLRLEKEEAEVLRNRVGELQALNTRLVAAVGRLEGGEACIKEVFEEGEVKRASGRKSVGSRCSLGSGSGHSGGVDKE